MDRKVNDLTKTLKPYKSGWIAINSKKEVVAHAETFEKISEKVAEKDDVLLLPAAEDYFGFIT